MSVFISRTAAERYEVTVALAKNNFGDGSVYLEKMIQAGHHIEVQVYEFA